MTPVACPLAPEKNFFQGPWRDIYQAISKSEFAFFPSALSHQDAALLMPWTALNHIMGQHRLEPPRMRLVKEGKTIDAGVYCHIIEHKINRPISHIPIVHKVYAQMDQEATLVIDGVQETYPPLRAFVQDMEKELALIMQANLYLSTRTTRGFETHWDDHDVMIFQVHGCKTWSIFGSTRQHPLCRDFHSSCPPPTEPIWTHTLAPGDVLYIPRGVWHHAVALDEPCMHLTVGLTRPTGITVVEWLRDLLREEEFMRRDLPLFHQPEAWQDYYQQLSQTLCERLQQKSMKDFYVDYISRLILFPDFSFPSVLTKEGPSAQELRTCTFSWISKVSPPIFQDEQEISFQLDQKQWVFSKKVLPFFELMNQGKCSFAQARSSLDDSIDDALLTEFLKTLIMQGLISSSPCHT